LISRVGGAGKRVRHPDAPPNVINSPVTTPRCGNRRVDHL